LCIVFFPFLGCPVLACAHKPWKANLLAKAAASVAASLEANPKNWRPGSAETGGSPEAGPIGGSPLSKVMYTKVQLKCKSFWSRADRSL